jgi:D-beta-D-heptose 7-phosphate kinase/D-beta-D-heptose 1-phosphate adenosyltransferase
MKRIMSRKRALEIMENFPRSGVMVVGDIMADHFIWGRVSRISPEAPVPVVEVSKDRFMLGGCSNVLNNVFAMGGRVHLAGVIGSDETGRRLMAEFEARGVATDGIVVEKAVRRHSRHGSWRTVSRWSGSIRRIAGRSGQERPKDPRLYPVGKDDLGALVISDYNKG